MTENRTEEEWDHMRARLEIPPPGYTGSLVGTVWDPVVMAASYSDETW